MFRHYKKLFLTLVALFSVFVLASCSPSNSQNAAQTEAPKVETIDGDWELVDIPDAFTESIGAYTLKAINFARLFESVQDFKMDMKIENNTATIKYDYNIDNFIKALMLLIILLKKPHSENILCHYIEITLLSQENKCFETNYILLSTKYT